MTRIELATTRGVVNSSVGFNAAEAGLNLRAEAIRSFFVGYNRPTGTSPTSTNPCVGSNQGSGTFACQSNTLGSYTTTSYVSEDPTNPAVITIPPGERYQNLTAQEYQYTAVANAKTASGKVAAMLQLNFKSRLVPLFQFAAFYNKDLEILPGPSMTLTGPIHTNGDLYLNTDSTLTIQGQVTTAGRLFRGRKDQNTATGTVRVFDPSTARTLGTTGVRRQLTTSDVTAFNNMIQIGVPLVTVPQPDVLDPQPGKTYWDSADLRVVLRLNNSHVPQAIEVRTATNVNNSTQSTRLMSCVGTASGDLGTNKVVNTNATLYNNREGKFIRMLNVDMRNLLECLYANNSVISGRSLSDTTEGGLIFHFSVSGPDSTVAASRYGVRIFNAAQLRANSSAAPLPVGMTVVTDGAIYLQGDFNATNKIPAAALVDSFNVLSNDWLDSRSTQTLGNRTPTTTTQQLAILAGTDTTGGQEGSAGQNGAYSGGLENFPRFLENWNGTVTYTYRGSFASLNRPRRVNGAWVYGGAVYTAPVRNWNYDTSFNSAQNLPPITPRFVYLKQQLFVRNYDQAS
ncbi:MAG: hypothetical protein EBZ48_05920 [Proteobacteria bacterium]|nr:hypothetical protein [Pseudomonadota bacterium]